MIFMGHIGTHIQACFSITQVLDVSVKRRMDQSANFNNDQIFPLQPKFSLDSSTPLFFKDFLFFLDAATRIDLSEQEASYGREQF